MYGLLGAVHRDIYHRGLTGYRQAKNESSIGVHEKYVESYFLRFIYFIPGTDKRYPCCFRPLNADPVIKLLFCSATGGYRLICLRRFAGEKYQG